MPSGHYMLDVAPHERCLPYGVGCRKYDNCFTCPEKDCHPGNGMQPYVKREVVTNRQIINWVDKPLVKLS